jgi:hypothetical protein
MKRFLPLIIVLSLGLTPVSSVYAQVSVKEALGEVSKELQNEVKEGTFSNLPTLYTEDPQFKKDPVTILEFTLLHFVINPIFFLAAGIAIFMILWAAKSLLVGTVMEDEIAKAKKTLIWAIVGLALITFSYTIVSNITGRIAEMLLPPEVEEEVTPESQSSNVQGRFDQQQLIE